MNDEIKPIYGAIPPDPAHGVISAKVPFSLLLRVQGLARREHRSVASLLKHLILRELEKEQA